MPRNLSDWFRFTLLVSIVVTPVLLSPTARADERRTLIRNAALILTMDPSVGQGELGLIADADLLFEGDTIAALVQLTTPNPPRAAVGCSRCQAAAGDSPPVNGPVKKLRAGLDIVRELLKSVGDRSYTGLRGARRAPSGAPTAWPARSVVYSAVVGAPSRLAMVTTGAQR